MAAKRILVVDDEPDILNTLALSLQMEGYEVITASDGKEALEKAYTTSPDLVILDIMLPTIDGYEISRMLKFNDKYKHIYLIMLTALAQKTDKEQGQKAGADFYMLKPVELDELNNKIKELLK